MARSPDKSAASGAGGRHGSPWRAAGVAIVAALALGGAGMVGVAFNTEQKAPPQPAAGAVAPSDLASLLGLPPPGAATARTATPGAATVPPGATPGTATATPGAATPGAATPRAATPRAATPRAATPRAATPGAAAGGAAAPGAGTPAPPAGPVTPAPRPTPSGPVPLARSEPVDIRIPKIGVKARTLSLGLDKDGMVAVPPLDQAQHASWFKLGPSPGETGPAVIVGHVDSAKMGPAVFFRLGSLRRGDSISVNRKDGSTATFVVDAVTSVPKKAFPTDLVYKNTPLPTLRIITCGGKFDRTTGDYPNNTIVFATMSATPRL